MRPSDVTAYRSTDTYVGISATRCNRPKTAELYGAVEMASGIELTGGLVELGVAELHRYFVEFPFGYFEQ
jgi:hypothetical protein